MGKRKDHQETEKARAELVIKDYISSAINLFINDRPDTALQLGYLECLLEMARTFGCDPCTFAMGEALSKVVHIQGVPTTEN